MTQCIRVIGGAGTGKTAMMKDIAEKALARPETGGSPFAIGFSSFTRAARLEAATRCGAAWGVPPEDLMREGWFRTVHSVCSRQLGSDMPVQNDPKWISEALGADVAYSLDEDGVGVYTGDEVAAAALNYWSFARNVCRPLREIVEADPNPEAPAASEVIRRIEQYETCKRLDGVMDFTDLLCRFVGIRFDPVHGPQSATPEGQPPEGVVGWIFDEAQDSSKLLDMACRRLLEGEDCKWGWTVGDPYQAIHAWCGASADNFMSWDVVKQHVMPQSYRCPPQVMALGERCLQRLPDYWDRGIAPASHDGEIIESDNFYDDLASLRPDEDTLVLARTKFHVKKIKDILEDCGVPHRHVKAMDGTYHRDLAMAGLWALERGEGIDGTTWGHILEILPSAAGKWLVRGAKTKWKKDLANTFDRVYPSDLESLGATEQLQGAITAGEWKALPDGGQKWYSAAKKWGVEAVSSPKIRLGTIHSSKGMEASTVVLLTSVNARTRQSEEQDPVRFAEERRVEYVAVTRAKNRLIVAHDPRSKYKMELPL